MGEVQESLRTYHGLGSVISNGGGVEGGDSARGKPLSWGEAYALRTLLLPGARSSG